MTTTHPSANDSGLNLDHLEARTQNMELVIARLEQIVGGCDNASEHAEEALICARAALANQPAPTVPADALRQVVALLVDIEDSDEDDEPHVIAGKARLILETVFAHQPAQEQAEPDLWVQYIDGVKTQNVARDAEEKATVERIHRIMAPGTAMTWRAFFAAQQEPVAAPQQAQAPKGGAQLLAELLGAPSLYSQVYVAATVGHGWSGPAARDAADAAVQEYGDSPAGLVEDLQSILDEVLRVDGAARLDGGQEGSGE